MAKGQSFAAKVAKASGGPTGLTCETCGEIFTTVKLVVSEKTENGKAWKFNQNLVRVCKCNQAKVYG